MFSKYIIGAIQLDPATYSDISSDPSVLKQAMVLALLSSVATGIGNVGGYPERIPLASAFALLAWLAWVLLIYLLGAKVFRETGTQTDIGALFRIAGFASLPGLLRLLAYFPPFSAIVSGGATIWMTAMMVVGVKAAFSYPRMSPAVGATLLSWPLYQWLLLQG